VVIHDHDVIGIAMQPAKANAPLFIDTNAVLAATIARQRLESVSRRDPKLVEQDRSMDHPELAPGYPLDIRGKPPAWGAVPELRGLPVRKAADHGANITLTVI
jgi:hypothetical protein